MGVKADGVDLSCVRLPTGEIDVLSLMKFLTHGVQPNKRSTMAIIMREHRCRFYAFHRLADRYENAIKDVAPAGPQTDRV